MRWLIACALALLLGRVEAADPGVWDIASEGDSHAVAARSGTAGAAYSTVPGGGAKMSGQVAIPKPTGGAVTVPANAVMTRQFVLRTGANLIARAAFPITVAGLIYDAYHRVRIAPREGDPYPGLGWDEGQPQEPVNQYCTQPISVSGSGCTTISNRKWCSTLSATNAVNDANSVVSSACTTQPRRLVIGASGAGGNVTYYLQIYMSGTWSTQQTASTTATPATQCPAYTDPFDPQYNVPAGSPVESDGKCRTGRYTQPRTADEASDAARNSQHADNLDYGGMMREAANLPPLGGGIDLRSPDVTTDVEIPTPAPSVPGATTTTTNPDGSTIEHQVAYDLTPGATPGRVSWRKTETTTTRDAAGNTTGTSTTTTTPPPVTTAPGTPPADDAGNPCKTNPNSIGCSEFGEVENTELQQDSRSVSFTPQSGWGAFTASCPAPSTASLSIGPVVMDNTLLCTFLASVRVLLVSVALVVGALIFVGGVRQ